MPEMTDRNKLELALSNLLGAASLLQDWLGKQPQEIHVERKYRDIIGDVVNGAAEAYSTVEDLVEN